MHAGPRPILRRSNKFAFDWFAMDVEDRLAQFRFTANTAVKTATFEPKSWTSVTVVESRQDWSIEFSPACNRLLRGGLLHLQECPRDRIDCSGLHEQVDVFGHDDPGVERDVVVRQRAHHRICEDSRELGVAQQRQSTLAREGEESCRTGGAVLESFAMLGEVGWEHGVWGGSAPTAQSSGRWHGLFTPVASAGTRPRRGWCVGWSGAS